MILITLTKTGVEGQVRLFYSSIVQVSGILEEKFQAAVIVLSWCFLT